jgi:DNA-binding response OmpR family regulator
LQPDITLLDLVLPDSPNWSETVTSIRKFTPPVIVVTESYDRAAEIAAFAAGAEDVLRKSTVLQIASILISAIAAARMRRIARDARNEQ